jgi:hypothetical protein
MPQVLAESAVNHAWSLWTKRTPGVKAAIALAVQDGLGLLSIDEVVSQAAHRVHLGGALGVQHETRERLEVDRWDPRLRGVDVLGRQLVRLPGAQDAARSHRPATEQHAEVAGLPVLPAAVGLGGLRRRAHLAHRPDDELADRQVTAFLLLLRRGAGRRPHHGRAELAAEGAGADELRQGGQHETHLHPGGEHYLLSARRLPGGPHRIAVGHVPSTPRRRS